MAATSNVEQAETWNGDEGAHWVAHQARYDAMMQRLTPRLLDAADPATDDRTLDVGCGCGETTRRLAGLTHPGLATGVDLSVPMLDRARQLAAAKQVGNVVFEQGDVQVYPFDDGTFDAAVSRYGVMMFADPNAAFANIGRALRHGGTLTFLCWQDALANEWLAVPAGAALAHVPMPDLGGDGPGPFSLADRDRLIQILDAAGWDDIDVQAVDEPMLMGQDPDDVVEFMRGTDLARGLLQSVPDETAQRALDAMRDALVPFQRDDGVWLRSASWLVRATR